MYAMLLTAVVLAQPPAQPPTQPTRPGQAAQPGQAGQPGQPGTIPRAGAMAQSLDGDWQVLALEKDGRPIDGAATFTVSVRNNVVTFSGGEERNRPQAMRIEFGPSGTIRLTEQGAGDRPGAGANERPAAGQPAPASPTASAKTGVYIMAGDYLAVSLHDRSPGAAPGTRPGGIDTPARPANPPGTTAPGTTPPGTTPGIGQPGTIPPAPGTSTGFSAALPTEKASFTVVLKRSGAGRTPGSPGGIPDRR
jgi:hypothetical protein